MEGVRSQTTSVESLVQRFPAASYFIILATGWFIYRFVVLPQPGDDEPMKIERESEKDQEIKIAEVEWRRGFFFGVAFTLMVVLPGLSIVLLWQRSRAQARAQLNQNLIPV
mmetsp:Transcript_44927/g.88910  ORF Transcript_44927/g.88910 Transcript_44927/m.88910 type:complete len:111 (+) Transcript_44927:97-429(+)